MREFPVFGIARASFQLERVDYEAPESSGKQGGVQAGWPRWSAEWTLGTLTVDQSDEWEAMLTAQRKAQRLALARDVRRLYPKAYPNGFAGLTRAGGGEFDGTATSWAVTVDAEGDCHLTLNGLPASLNLSRLDYVGFKWVSVGGTPGVYDRFTMVRLSSPVAASVGGVAIATVEPALPTPVPAGAIAYLDRPACLMKLVSDQTQIAETDRLMTIKGTKVSAIQVLLP